MADFITKAEKGRRLAILIVCIIIDTLAIAGGIYSLKTTGDIEEGEDIRDNIKILKKEVADLRVQRREIEVKLEEFGDPIGWRISSPTTNEALPTGRLQEQQLKLFLDMWVDELAYYGVGNFQKWSQGATENDGLTVTKLFDTLQSKIDWYKNEVSKLDDDIEKLEKEEKATLEQMEAADRIVREEIEKPGDGLIDEYKKLLETFTKQEDNHEVEIRTLEEDWRKKEDEYTILHQGVLRTKITLQSRKAELTTRINWIMHRREEARERKDPDGFILGVESKMQIAYIDITHKDRLFKGTKFRVYELRKGGIKLDKGVVEVIEVGLKRSKVAILKLFTEEPLRVDDRIYNEYFERGKARYIAFAGRFSGKLSNLEAARKVKEFGDIYQRKVNEKTNYLVVGPGYEDDPNYKQALEWGVKILIERYLYDYLGVP